LRFERDTHDGIKPYVRVRGDLWALVTRPLALDLVGLGEEREAGGETVLGVAVAGAFFSIAKASEVEGFA